MPVRIVVRLDPARPEAVPPPHTGPAVNAAFLDAVRDADSGLAAVLHDSPRYKPFTLTPLLDDRDCAPSAPGSSARFEVGLLVDGHTATVLGALQARPGYVIGETEYRTAEVSVDAIASFEDLAHQARPRAAWGFRLLTPVSFATVRDEGPRRERPWPEPVRVFRNLAQRWNTFACGVTLPEQVHTVIEQHLETSGGQVRIVEHLIEPSQRDRRAGYRHGTVGRVSYRLAGPGSAPEEGKLALDALAAFACFAGFGDRTANGMGYV
ncbi:MAG: CRISPR system precrRNA processing endoribonuclease RAMP protein Cas6, partial [Pseudonocardiaceae bacterium]